MSDDSTALDDGPMEARWRELCSDLAETVARYRQRGWSVLELDVADVTPEPESGERYGLHVLVPDGDYESLSTRLESPSVEFDAATVHRRDVGELSLAQVIELDVDGQIAVAYPVYYTSTDALSLLEASEASGVFPIHVGTLSFEEWITFEHEDPSLFEPGR